MPPVAGRGPRATQLMLNNGATDMILKGDIITFKLEWRDEGDKKYTFVARDDENNGYVDYSAIELADWAIWSVHIAKTSMIEAVVGHVS
jgi:hypothetical protein